MKVWKKKKLCFISIDVAMAVVVGTMLQIWRYGHSEWVKIWGIISIRKYIDARLFWKLCAATERDWRNKQSLNNLFILWSYCFCIIGKKCTIISEFNKEIVTFTMNKDSLSAKTMGWSDMSSLMYQVFTSIKYIYTGA